MDLDTLIFRVNTDQLDEARIKIAKLGDAVGALNKPLQDMARSSAKTNEVIAKSELAAEKARVAQKSLSDTVSESTTKVDPLTKLMEKLNNTYIDMSQGMSKGESSILNQARNLGAMGDQLQAVASILQNIKTLNKDPFDASLGGVRSITQEFERLQQRADLAQQGILMTTKQLGEYSKLSAEAKGRVVGMGLDPESVEGQKQYNELLSASQKEYLNVLQVVKQLTDEEKKRLDVLKEQERLQQAAQSASAARMQEWAKGVGGKSPELTSMAAFYKEQEVASRKLAAAEDDLILREQKLAFVNKELAAGLSTASANALFKYQKDLEAIGKSADEVSQRMTAFRAGLVERQGHSPMAKLLTDTETTSKRLDHLSRALGPQITDIFVGLATGQSLLTVALQQGGQIRDQIALSGIASAEAGMALSRAATTMVASLKDTSTAIGSLLITPFIAAGKAMSDFGLYIVGATNKYKLLRAELAMAEDSGNRLATFTYRLLGSIPTILGSIVAGFVAFGVASAVAFFAVEKQVKALTTNLILTGGSIGVTTDAAIRMAESMESVGISSFKALGVMTEMAKQGGFTSKEIELVTKSAVQMQAELGVSVEDTVKQFAKLKEDPVNALLKVAEQTGLVNTEVLATVISLDQQGKKADATALAMQAYGDVTVAQVQRAKQEYTEFAQLMIDIGKGLGKFWDSMKEMWISASPSNQLAQRIEYLNASINSFGIGSDYKKKLEEERTELQKKLILLQDVNFAEQQKNNTQSASAKVLAEAKKTTEQYLTGLQKLSNERVKAKNEQEELNAQFKRGAIDQIAYDAMTAANKIKLVKINDDIAKENKKNNAESVSAANKHQDELKKAINTYEDIVGISDGVTKSYNEQVAALILLGKEGTKSPEQIAEAFAKLEEQQPRFKEQTKELEKQRKISEDIIKTRNELVGKFGDVFVKQEIDLKSVQEENNLVAYRKTLIGQTQEQQERLIALYKIDVETQKEINKIRSQGFTGSQEEVLIENQRKLGEERKKSLVVLTDDQKRTQEYAKSFENLFSSMGDAIAEFALTGKMNFGDLVSSMIADLIKFEMRLQMSNLYKGVGGASGIIGSITSTFSGSDTTGGGFTEAMNSYVSAGGTLPTFAKGGTFTNSVVSSPTLFKFAKGTGLMGEAGPEAIMPLTRGSDGSLGVRAEGSGSNVEIVINNNSNATATASETVDSKGNRKIEVMIGEATAGEISRSGSSPQRSIRSTFGLQPALIRR